VQGVGLAADAVLLWGGLGITWTPVGLTTMYLVRHCRALLRLGDDIERVLNIYTCFSPFTPTSTFLHVISNIRRCQATDPRDKVFALMSHPTAHTISTTSISLNWNAYKPALPLALRLLPSLADQYLVKERAKHTNSNTPPDELPAPLLKADYTKTVEEVYLELAWDHITRTRSVEILTAVQNDPGNSSALSKPSWVP
jgi:hypothetical protein